MSNNDLLNKKIGERLTKELIRVYGPKRGFYVKFIKDLNERHGYPREDIDSGYVSRATLSNIAHGETGIHNDRAQAFAEVLGVSTNYLLCIDEYPSKSAEKKAILEKTLNDWNLEYLKRIEEFKRVFETLSNTCTIRFYIKNMPGVIVYENKTFKMYGSDEMSVIPDDLFYYCFLTPELSFPYHDGKKQQYIHIADKVYVFRDESYIDLEINDFIRMIHDIDYEIKMALHRRLDFWFEFSDYDYREDFNNSYAYWDE